MSWLDGIKNLGRRRGEAPGDTDSVRRIAASLGSLEPDRARFLAAFTYVLSRAAGADLQISSTETDRMIAIVERIGHLPRADCALIVGTAAVQSRRYGGTEDFLVTREFREISTEDERRELLDCLFEVAANGERMASAEESQIRQIASELGFAHDEYVAMRMKWLSARADP